MNILPAPIVDESEEAQVQVEKSKLGNAKDSNLVPVYTSAVQSKKGLLWRAHRVKFSLTGVRSCDVWGMNILIIKWMFGIKLKGELPAPKNTYQNKESRKGFVCC